jgi:hypothetical protein
MLLNGSANKPLNIRIYQVEHRPGFYAAMHKAELFQATFLVCFPDDISGAVSLKIFAEMLERQYNTTVKIHLRTDKPIAFKSSPIMDFITTKQAKYKKKENN